MKITNMSLLGLLALVTLMGCIDLKVADGPSRIPTEHIDLFVGGMKPTRKYKEIGEMSFSGDLKDEKKTQRRFIRKAKASGGDGLVFEVENTPTRKDPVMFKGRVLVYE